jgi:hypothetical protein
MLRMMKANEQRVDVLRRQNRKDTHKVGVAVGRGSCSPVHRRASASNRTGREGYCGTSNVTEHADNGLRVGKEYIRGAVGCALTTHVLLKRTEKRDGRVKHQSAAVVG